MANRDYTLINITVNELINRINSGESMEQMQEHFNTIVSQYEALKEAYKDNKISLLGYRTYLQSLKWLLARNVQFDPHRVLLEEVKQQINLFYFQ